MIVDDSLKCFTDDNDVFTINIQRIGYRLFYVKNIDQYFIGKNVGESVDRNCYVLYACLKEEAIAFKKDKLQYEQLSTDRRAIYARLRVAKQVDGYGFDTNTLAYGNKVYLVQIDNISFVDDSGATSKDPFIAAIESNIHTAKKSWSNITQAWNAITGLFSTSKS